MDKETLQAIADMVLGRVLPRIAQLYPTNEQARVIAREAVPSSLRYLDQSIPSGAHPVLSLGMAGAQWVDLAASAAAAASTKPFFAIQTDALKFTMNAKHVYFAGVEATVVSWPTDGKVTVSGPTAHKWYCWLEIDYAGTGTVTYNSGGALPASTGTVEIWALVEITTNSDDTAISTMIQRWDGDLHVTGAALG